MDTQDDIKMMVYKWQFLVSILDFWGDPSMLSESSWWQGGNLRGSRGDFAVSRARDDDLLDLNQFTRGPKINSKSSLKSY